jgi:type VI secretion system protein ImpI/type VI secretion system protein
MAISLRFHSSGAVPGDGRPIVMRGQNLTIGRGPENDLVLPDPDRLLSKSHCVLENHNGSLVVVDLSTNGTFLNYGKIPLGRTPTPLNHGDVLVMGPYELVVEITEASTEPLAPLALDPASFGSAARAPDPMQLLDDAGPGGDFLDNLLGTPAPKGPAQFRPKDDFDGLLPPLGEDDPLLGPAPVRDSGPAQFDHGASGSDAFRAPAAGRSVIPDDWDDLLAPLPQTGPKAAPEPGPPFDPFATDPNRKPKPPEPPVQTAVVEPPPPPPAAPAPAGSPDAARVFLSAIGAEDIAVADADLPATMGRLGRTMRAMITGLREILMTRASIKSEFRIEQTMITAGSNNPLKFSISPEQAIEAMVRPQVKGYLPAEEAAAQALEDVKAHEIAMVTGMEAALKGLLAKLDPKALAGRIEANGPITFLKNRKAQYWEVYEAMYAEISDQAENDFNELFAREFARAYKDQLARLKAESRGKE